MQMDIKVNVGSLERAASVVLGGLALSQAVNSQRPVAARAAAGGAAIALLWRGISGNCPVYSGLEVNSVKTPANKPQTWIERSAAVNLPIDEVRVYLTEGDYYYGRFTSSGPDNFEINLDGRLWMLSLKPHVDGKRTIIRLSWDDHGESYNIVDSVRNAKQPAPRILELRKLKSLLETGEIPSIEGQSHGERSRFGSFVEHFGDLVIEKIQSRSSLPEDPHLNQETPVQKRYLKEANA